MRRRLADAYEARMDWFERITALREGRLPAADAAFDDAEPVRWECARTPGLDARLVRSLARDPSASVRAAIAGRPDLDARLVEDLSWDDSPLVRAAVAGRADLDEGIRARLRGDMDERVLAALGEWDRALLIQSMPERPKPSKKKWFR